MSVNITAKFSVLSLLFYFFLGIIPIIVIKIVKKRELITGKQQSPFSLPYLVWWIIWTFFASFRLVSDTVGGADAYSYKDYFSVCFSSNLSSVYTNYEYLFQLLTKSVRYFTSDYHIYFLVIYGFITFSIVYFINEFTPKKTSYCSYILIFHLFLRSFNTIRSNLAISLILVGIVLIHKNKRLLGYSILISSFFFHKSSILYILIILLYKINSRYKIKLKYYFLLAVAAIVAGSFAQKFLVYGNSSLRTLLSKYIKGSYVSYASRALSTSFFDDFWKIAFEQLLLLFLVILFYKWFRMYMNSLEDNIEKQRLKNIFMLCCLDFVSIPITYILGIWRGYEFLYMARIILWGEMIYIIKLHSSQFSIKIINVLSYFAFFFWLTFRIYTTWESSHLMPYVFEPFISLLY